MSNYESFTPERKELKEKDNIYQQLESAIHDEVRYVK